MNRVWLNGALLPAADARIDPADRGFTLGDGVFETIRAVAGKPAYLDRHLARLRHGAMVLGIEIPSTDDALETALHDVAGGQDCALRLTLTRGPAPRGVLPSGPCQSTILITAGTLPAPLPPARVMTALTTRRNEHSPLSRIKSLNYGDSILARREAAAQGFDDALLLNTRGNIVEATASTIILLLNGVFITPHIVDGALPGITRGRLIELGLVTEACVTQDVARRASAAVLVNSLSIRALSALDQDALDPNHPALDKLRNAADASLFLPHAMRGA